MAGVVYTGPHVFTSSPASGRIAAPVTTRKAQILPVPKSTPAVHPPTPKPIGGFKTLCAGCGGRTDAGLPAPVQPPRDNVARSPAPPVGASSGITNPVPPSRAGVTDFGSGITAFGSTVAAAPASISVAAKTPAVDAAAAAPEPTNNNTAIALAGGAVLILILGAIFL